MTKPSPTTSALVALGAERLAEALLELADRSDDASRMVTRLTATPAEKTRSFKSRLAGLRRLKFKPSRKASEFAARLEDILSLLDADSLAPKAGVELVGSFYKTDKYVFESVDDSRGYVGDVFRIDAVDRLAEFAKRCDDHEWLVSLLFDLLVDDPYDVRFHILDHAAEYLPAEALRTLADRFWDAASASGDAQDEYNRERDHWLSLVQKAATQLNDPELFEKARRLYDPDLGVAACLDIAQAYASAGKPEVALEWLNRVDPDASFMSYEREQLLMEVLKDLGRGDELEKLVRYRFQQSRNESSLSDLLEVVGEDQREDIVSGATAEILQADVFSRNDAKFLAECGRGDAAAVYIVRHHQALDGEFWSPLLKLAERMNADGHVLAATVLYRALVDSVLDHASSRAYGHAARHLRILDKLAEDVKDWSGVTPHAEYQASLRTQHKLKSTFWSRYLGT